MVFVRLYNCGLCLFNILLLKDFKISFVECICRSLFESFKSVPHILVDFNQICSTNYIFILLNDLSYEQGS